MAGWLKKLFGASETSSRALTDTSQDGIYSGLRNQALTIKRSDVGIPEPLPGFPVWGVLMETDYSGVTATLFTLADGTASLYFSYGGGILGGQGIESVREAVPVLIETANEFRELLLPWKIYPVPDRDQTIFYALTDSGILGGGGQTRDFGNGDDPLSPLFMAAHGVITALRINQESAEKQEN